MATVEQLDRLAAAALARRSTVEEIVACSNDSPDLVRDRAARIVADEAEYKAALDDVAASS
jgi:hypothetical protein